MTVGEVVLVVAIFGAHVLWALASKWTDDDGDDTPKRGSRWSR